MDTTNTIIILDWDDTLFPTSWILYNNIDLTDPHNRITHFNYFQELDNILHELLSNMCMYGEVIIITNAMIKWIELSASVLNKTQKLLNKIKIVSARENYNKTTEMKRWKELCFMDEINNKNNVPTNVISMGDANYEYNAVINLYKTQKYHDDKYFKTVHFLRNPDKNIILEELNLINNHLYEICSNNNHLDLDFSKIIE